MPIKEPHVSTLVLQHFYDCTKTDKISKPHSIHCQESSLPQFRPKLKLCQSRLFLFLNVYKHGEALTTIKVQPILILEANEQGVGMMRPGSYHDRTWQTLLCSLYLSFLTYKGELGLVFQRSLCLWFSLVSILLAEFIPHSPWSRD